MAGLISRCLIIAVIAGIVRCKTHWYGARRDGEKLWLNPKEGILAGSNIPIHFIGSRGLTLEDARSCLETINNTEFSVPVMGKYIRLSLHGQSNHLTITSSVGSDDSIVYPRIFVVVDYETFKLHGQNVEQLVKYLLAFWNGVDLKFRGLFSPKVRLHIAGILIATHNDAFSFISENKDSSDEVNGDKALVSFAEAMKRVDLRLWSNRYDIAVAMHPYTMRGLVKGFSKIIPHGTANFFGALGEWDRRTSENAPVAIIQDKGGFHGIINAARQLARLFGAAFDQREGAYCSANHGYILSQIANKRLYWSDCSLQAFDEFFHSEHANHFFEQPQIRFPLPRLLPGRLLTADQQCEKTIGSKADQSKKDKMCLRLRCKNEPSAYASEEVRFPAADGTVCGTGKICIDGQCVNDPEL